MPFEPRRTAERFADMARAPAPPPDDGWPVGAPEREYWRSPAASEVARLAARDGLFLFHYEHRAQLPLPVDWVPGHEGSLGSPAEWVEGVLPERKYQSFRHDQMIGGFHPGHRAKWSTHELCHGLVGFAWRADQTPFFVALAGRLAELLPVTLWYFLDEVNLRRCRLHQGQGAMFRAFCPACEPVAEPFRPDPRAEDRLSDGLRFLDAELAAVARSRRLGRPVPNRWATIDLSSDGVAYAAAHSARLRSETFLRYASLFLAPCQSYAASLDELEDRVVATASAITTGTPLPARAPDALRGRWRWVLQDVGWRLATVLHDTEGEARGVLEDLLVELSEAVPLTSREDVPIESLEAAVGSAIRSYRELHRDYVLPTPDDVFAVGYDLPEGYGRSVAHIEAGIRSTAPRTATLLGERLRGLVTVFVAQDGRERVHLGRRWARFLRDEIGGMAADLATLEAEVADLPPYESDALALGAMGADYRVRVPRGAAIVQLGIDALALADAVDAGTVQLEERDGRLVAVSLDGEWEPEPTAFALVREPGGDVQLVGLDLATSEALQVLDEGAEILLPPGEEEALRAVGVLVPCSWPEGDGDEEPDEDTQPF